MGSANIANVLANGTTENNSFKSKLDYIAGELQMLKNANVAVLWAPFHEYQQGGWFWPVARWGSMAQALARPHRGQAVAQAGSARVGVMHPV